MPNLIRRKEQSVSFGCAQDKRAVDFDLKRCQELEMISGSIFEKGFRRLLLLELPWQAK